MLGSGAKFTEMPKNSVIKINHILMLCLKIITVDAKIFMLNKIPNLENKKINKKRGNMRSAMQRQIGI